MSADELCERQWLTIMEAGASRRRQDPKLADMIRIYQCSIGTEPVQKDYRADIKIYPVEGYIMRPGDLYTSK